MKGKSGMRREVKRHEDFFTSEWRGKLLLLDLQPAGFQLETLSRSDLISAKKKTCPHEGT